MAIARQQRSLCFIAIALFLAGLNTACQRSEAPPTLYAELVDLLPYADQLDDGGNPAQRIEAEDENRPDGLFVPFGRQVDFFLNLPPHSRLDFSGCRFLGSQQARLEISLENDLEGAPVLLQIAASERAGTIPLTKDEQQAIKVSFRAVSEDPGSAEGGVLLEAPAVLHRVIPSPEPTGGEEGSLRSDPPSEPPHVIIYLVDTLRPDHLGAYGYPKPTSPNIDRFADRATLYEYAVGQSSWTKPSVASLFTGKWPRSHGVTGRKSLLPTEFETLAEVLRDNGYRTAAVFTNPNVSSAFQLDQGFENVTDLRSGKSDRGADVVVDAAIEAIERSPESVPLFLYIHTQDPHHPYKPPQEYRKRFAPNSDEVAAIIERNPRKEIWTPTDSIREQLSALYDAEIGYNDAHFGRLVEYLQERGLFDDTLLVFISDHGEEFYEHHRWGHGRNVNVEELNVALIVKLPGQTEGERVSEAVQHIDLFPTVLDYLGIEIPGFLEGQTLLAPPQADVKKIYSHTHVGSTYSFIHGDYKLVERWKNRAIHKHTLFNWREDPRELHDLIEARPILAAAMAADLRREVARRTATEVKPQDAVLDEETRERLRALGYLN